MNSRPILVPAEKAASGHVPALDGIRALSCLFVLFAHLPEVPRTKPMSDMWYLFTGWMTHGRIAVTFFIALSGFCLMMRFVRSKHGAMSWKEFYRRRIRRTLPAYYAILLINVVVLGLIYGPSFGLAGTNVEPVTPSGTLAAFILNMDLMARFDLNPPAWTVSVEWKLYLLFPLMVWLLRRKGWLVALLCTFAGAFAWYRLTLNSGLKYACIQFTVVFLVGMMGAWMLYDPTCPVRRWKNLPWGRISGALGIWILMLCLRWSGFQLEQWQFPFDIATSFFAVAFIIYVAKEEGTLVRRALSQRHLVWVGTISYSLYLIHALIFRGIWRWTVLAGVPGSALKTLIVFVVGMPVAFACAWGCYKLFEEPFMRHRKRAVAQAPAADVGLVAQAA